MSILGGSANGARSDVLCHQQWTRLWTSYDFSAAQVDLSASTSGPLAGVLFFQDRNVKTNLPNTLLENSTAQFNGTLYFPTAEVLYSGGTACSRGPTIIVADTIDFSGTCNLR